MTQHLQGNPIKLTDSSSERMKARKQWVNIFKVLKEKQQQKSRFVTSWKEIPKEILQVENITGVTDSTSNSN